MECIMDPDITLMFYCKTGKFIHRDSCKVTLSDDFNRKDLPPPYENNINDIWKARLSANPKLFNGTKFRVASVYEEPNSNLFVLCLGVTCYKDFIGTNWSPDAKQLTEQGIRDYSDPQAYMSDALGVGALVLTTDNYVILLRRSQHCGEAAGLWDVPGGHAEPEEIVGKVEMNDINLGQMCVDGVKHEVYNSIIREVRDEVNIAESYLGDPQLMGIARNTTSAGRPSLEFLIRCSLSSSEVLIRYKEGTQTEFEESTNIKLLPADKVFNIQNEDTALWKNLAPSAKGCLTLYTRAVNSIS